MMAWFGTTAVLFRYQVSLLGSNQPIAGIQPPSTTQMAHVETVMDGGAMIGSLALGTQIDYSFRFVSNNFRTDPSE